MSTVTVETIKQTATKTGAPVTARESAAIERLAMARLDGKYRAEFGSLWFRIGKLRYQLYNRRLSVAGECE